MQASVHTPTQLLIAGASSPLVERVTSVQWEKEGFALRRVNDSAELLERARPDDAIVISDALTEGEGVLHLIQSCRHVGVGGIVVLMGRSDPAAELKLLEWGADECVSDDSLSAERLSEVLRRAQARSLARRSSDRKVSAPRLGISGSELDVHMRLALEASNTGIWAWDMITDEVEWSRECHLIHGVEDFAGSGAAFFDLVHPEDRARVAETVRAAAKEGRRYASEFRIVRPNGDIAWVENRGRAFHDVSGAPVRMLGTITDITARKRAEQAARDAQLLTQAIIDGAQALICAKDISGRYFLFNREWLELVGLTAEQARGKTDAEIFGDDAGVMGESDRVVVAERTLVVTKETLIVQGRSLTYLSSKFPLIDSRGEVYGVCAFSIDITEIEANERALARRERELQQLADNSPDIFSRFDRDYRHVFVSNAVSRATGMPRAAFIGKTNRELGMPSELCERWEAGLQRVFDTGSPEALEFWFDGDQGPRLFEAKLVPEVDSSGSVSHVLGVTRDVTERHAYGQALHEANRRKGEFITTLAHELRNPFATLVTGLEVLQLEAASPMAQRACAAMERQLRQCTRLIEDLLDASGVALGKVTLRAERVELQSVVAEAVEATRSVVEGSQHTLVLHLDERPMYVRGDGSRLSQVVGNLLTNAAKYTPPRGTIEVSLGVVESWAELQVSDSGIGISADQLEHVFVLFAQAKPASGSVKSGIGVGLAVVKSILELHGGSVAVRSDGPGKGSTFTVRLPLETET